MKADVCLGAGLLCSMVLAEIVYDIPTRVILDSAQRAVTSWDLVTSMIKSWVFGTVISVVHFLSTCMLMAYAANCLCPQRASTARLTNMQVSCAWGFTTTGGAKGVGESTTSAVVISLVLIFVFDFGLSYLFFQGQGDALAQLA